eukprot:TRINITY_DN57413_c0_g1_i2.p1 TRINITY_DN57413_c0_g1~~TRINITY_DN57413_c0_g1_i2.p1  ORF type:complete len:541 (+),score=112.16 TRINITY_DN57413_c0_g1_i2:122-1624(+)
MDAKIEPSPGRMFVRARDASRIFFSSFLYYLVEMTIRGLIGPLFERVFDGDDRTAAVYFGVAAGMSALLQFTFLPASGVAADRVGRRLLLNISTLGSAFDCFGCAVVGIIVLNSHNATALCVGILFLSKCVSGATGCFGAIEQGYIADKTTPDQRVHFYTWNYVFSTAIPMVIGPLAGSEELRNGLGFPISFFILFCILILNSIWICSALPESLSVKNESPVTWKRVNPVGTGMFLFKNLFFRGVVVPYVTVGFTFAGFAVILFFYARERYDMPAYVLLLALSVFALLSLVVLYLTMKLCKKIGERRVCVIGMTVGGIGMIIMGLSPNVAGFFLGLVLVACVPCVLPAYLSILTKNTEKKIFGEMMSSVTALMLLAAGIAAMLFPVMFYACTSDSADPKMPGAPLLLAGFLLLVCSVFLVFFFRRYPTDEIRVRDLFDTTGTEKERLMDPASSPSVSIDDGDAEGEIDQENIKPKPIIVSDEHLHDIVRDDDDSPNSDGK